MWKAQGSIPRISILYPSVCDSAPPHPQQLYFTYFHIDYRGKKLSPRPGIEPGPSTWQAEILTTRLSRTVLSKPIFQIVLWYETKKEDKTLDHPSSQAGFEPATFGCLILLNYSPPLYQLSYRRESPPFILDTFKFMTNPPVVVVAAVAL